MNQEDIDQITTILEQEPTTQFAYFYGSQVKGNQNLDSDIDIAVMLETDDHATLRRLQQQLQLITSKTIDLKRLKLSQHPVFLRNVIADGTRIAIKDDLKRVNFEVAVMRRYREDEGRRRIFGQYAQERFQRHSHVRP